LTRALKGDPGRRALELRKLLRRFTDVCDAIGYAHSRGVLHRDIKPGNVIVGKYGETLVVDWGLAKATGRTDPGAEPGERTLIPSSASGSAETLPGSALGTPAYMSPEQAEGHLDRLGARSDVYSLGATLCYLLTGRPPAEGERHDVLRAVQRGEIVPPRARDAAIDRALEAICLKAMAHDPEGRYATPRALSEDLERWTADEPVSAWREPVSARARRWMRRNRTAVGSAAALLITAVLGLAAGLFAVNRERARTVAERDRAERALSAETAARRRAREALDDTTSDVIEKFLSAQGAKLGPDQEAFLRKVLASYREFAAESGSSAEARAAVAEAHGRVGTILARIGQPEDARASFQRAVDLYEGLAADHPDRVAYRIARAGYRHKIAVIDLRAGRLAEAEKALRENLEVQRRLADLAPADPEAGRAPATTLTVLGNLLRRLGRGQDADSAYASAEDDVRRLAARPSAGPADRAALADVLFDRAQLQSDIGRSAEAEPRYRETIAILERLVAASPRGALERNHLARARRGLAYFLSEAGKTAEAEAAFRAAIAEGKQLAADFPAVPGYRSELADTLSNYAISCAGSGRYQEAEAAFRDDLALARQLAADFPTVASYRSGLAASLVNMGATYTISGRREEAAASDREAIAIFRGLASEFPDVPDHKASLGRTLFNLSLLLADGARREALRESIAVLRPIASARSIPLDDRLALAQSLATLGSGLNPLREGPEAMGLLRESLGLFDGLVADAPAVLKHREEQANAPGPPRRVSPGCRTTRRGRAPVPGDDRRLRAARRRRAGRPTLSRGTGGRGAITGRPAGRSRRARRGDGVGGPRRAPDLGRPEGQPGSPRIQAGPALEPDRPGRHPGPPGRPSRRRRDRRVDRPHGLRPGRRRLRLGPRLRPLPPAGRSRRPVSMRRPGYRGPAPRRRGRLPRRGPHARRARLSPAPRPARLPAALLGRGLPGRSILPPPVRARLSHRARPSQPCRPLTRSIASRRLGQMS
jgi:serine/threonine-protein kinase